MQVREIMTNQVVCCTPDTGLQEVAQMMVQHDCGAIPVVESQDNPVPVGMITDRDICCRSVAEGKNPLELQAKDCMTDHCATVTPETSLEECCQVLEDHQIRRAPVVDEQGRCCGVVAQADIALTAPEATAEVVREVSKHSAAASA